MIRSFATSDGPSSNILIPRIIHQTFSTVDIPDAYKLNVDKLKSNNPNWEYRFYDDSAATAYISRNYGSRELNAFASINSDYGAAKADLFRYLLLYNDGGIYLDLKSSFSTPIDDVLTGDEGYIISRWSNKPGEMHEYAGIHPELFHLNTDEFQQWHVICAPKHPFLKRVIDQVIDNVENYSPFRFGVGKRGVLRLTGPIAYTKAIAPVLDRYPCKQILNEQELGLQYSVSKGREHEIIMNNHYSSHTSSIVKLSGLKKFAANAYSLAKMLEKRAFPDGTIITRKIRSLIARNN